MDNKKKSGMLRLRRSYSFPWNFSKSLNSSGNSRKSDLANESNHKNRLLHAFSLSSDRKLKDNNNKRLWMKFYRAKQKEHFKSLQILSDTSFSVQISGKNDMDKQYTKSIGDKKKSGISIWRDKSKYYNDSLNRAKSGSTAINCLTWTIAEVGHFFRKLGFEKCVSYLANHHVDGLVLPFIQDQDLLEMGIESWESRRFIVIALQVLLKLRHRCLHKFIYSPERLTSDRRLLVYEIKHYEIMLDARVGEGGYGKVYRAQWIPRNSDNEDRDNAFRRAQILLQTYAESEKDSCLLPRDINLEKALEYIKNYSFAYSTRNSKAKKDCNSDLNGVTVAVKIFHPRNSKAVQQDFYSELAVLSPLRHPNVTLFLGVVMLPRQCLVTEYLPCGSLFDLLHRHHISLGIAQSVRIGREICYGMSYLHEQGVMHCDLKSSNILLSAKGQVKICDFGLATLRESPSDVDVPIHLGCVGTHHWMAPEGN